MRILQAHNQHAGRGGADDVLHRERRLLGGAGHQVEQFLVSPATESSMPPWRQGLAAVWNRDAVAELLARIDVFEPDVLHVHTPFPLMSPAVFRAAHRRGVGTVSTVHSFRFSCVAGTLLRDRQVCEDCVGSRLKLPAVRHRCYHSSVPASAALALSLSLHHSTGTFARHVDRFLPLTSFGRDVLVRDGIPADHITVKPNCTDDPSPLTPYGGRLPYVLFVGRLVEEKGIRTLLSGWRRAAPRQVRLRVAGDGPLRTLVENAAATDRSIEFLGWRQPAEITELQRNALVTIVPSEWYEAGPPLALLQALASATPVLCSDLGNICDGLVDAGAALTFRTGDGDSLAQQLTHMLSGGADLLGMSAASREVYEQRHTPATTMAVLERVYEDVRR